MFDSLCLASTRVFTDNPKWNINQIEKELIAKLGISKVYFIPEHPYDFTGHVDGLSRLVDSKTILVNNLSQEYQNALDERKTARGKLMLNWTHSFKAAIQNTSLEVLELTYDAHENTGMDAKGVYMNFLKAGKNIFMPTFDSSRNDQIAAKQLSEIFKDCQIHSIPASELDKHGGIINCITWQI